jgi:hypothetical protein
MDNKVVKFKEFITEDTYKVNVDGVIEKMEYELYKDWHPAKFKIYNMSNNKDVNLYKNDEYIWVIKKNDTIISTFSSNIDEELINNFFNNLKK